MTDGKMALVIAGGPAIYLLGAALFKLAAFGVVSPPRFVGIALIAALAAAAPWLTPLALAAAVNGVLILTAVWESAARPATVRRAPAL